MPARQRVQEVTQDPVAAYDRVARVFPDLAKKREAYLDSVDRIIISEIPAGTRSLLDVGAGDGARSHRIAREAKIPKLVLMEPSLAMQRRFSATAGGATVWAMRAEDLSMVQGSFDAITCQWNVLGHVFPLTSRMEVLRQFARLLSIEGRICLDVNHRYNASHYGTLRTAGRFLRDLVVRGEKSGDVVVAWEVDGARCATMGHVFTHSEVKFLSRAAGLKIEKRYVLNYGTGQTKRWGFQGHLLYVLRH